MKKLRILPGAAGIIALTATIGFIDGQRGIREDDFSKARIIQVSTITELAALDSLPPTELVNAAPDHPAYLVEIKQGDSSKSVVIDAVTARVLSA